MARSLVDQDERFAALKRGRSTRRPRRRGDVYALELRRGGYLSTRIASEHAVVMGMDGMYVVYVYAEVVDSLQDVCASATDLRRLLLPPVIVNRSCWTEGYMTFVAAYDDCPAEVVDRHVFRHPKTGELFDEVSERVVAADYALPVGKFTVTTSWGLDILIKNELA